MTNILSILLGNLTSGPETIRFPDRAAPRPWYRGSVVQNAKRCISCGICDTVCVSGAIELRTFDDHAEWAYDPGRCTFCGRCVLQCPVGALRQENDRLAPYADQGALVVTSVMAYPACTECGSPALPFGSHMLKRLLGASDEIFQRARLCEKCRQHRTQEAFKEAALKVAAAPQPNAGGRTDER